MKKALALFLLMLLVVPAAHAVDCTNLYDLQEVIYRHSPAELEANSVRASIKGTIIAIENVTGNHYNMTIQVDDPKATKPLGSDMPLVVGHFRLHLPSLDDAPFAVGGETLIVGELNSAYSTWIVPWLMIEEVNGYGSDEY